MDCSKLSRFLLLHTAEAIDVGDFGPPLGKNFAVLLSSLVWLEAVAVSLDPILFCVHCLHTELLVATHCSNCISS